MSEIAPHYRRNWNLFAFYGIFRDARVRESSLSGDYYNGFREFHVVQTDVHIPDWRRHHDFGAATIEPCDGDTLIVDVVALNEAAEKHVDYVEGVRHNWYQKRWARELFGYTWLGLNEPEIDCYVYQMTPREDDEAKRAEVAAIDWRS